MGVTLSYFREKGKVKSEEGKIVLTRLINEECRMKNEEWELLFLFVKREEGKIALTQYVRDGGDASYILYIWGGYIHYIYKERSEGRGKKAVAIWVLL